MAYTSHGHHIPGTFERDHRPGRAEKCGGVNRCESCIKESSKLVPQSTISPENRSKTIELVSYVGDKRVVLGEVEAELVLHSVGITTTIKVDPESSLHVWLNTLAQASGEILRGFLVMEPNKKEE